MATVNPLVLDGTGLRETTGADSLPLSLIRAMLPKLYSVTSTTRESIAIPNNSFVQIPQLTLTVTPRMAGSMFKLEARVVGEVQNGENKMFSLTANTTPIDPPTAPGNRFAGTSPMLVSYHNNYSSTLDMAYLNGVWRAPNRSPVTFGVGIIGSGPHTLWLNGTASAANSWGYERGTSSLIITEYLE